MGKRLIQVSGFLISTMGWLFVLCTLAMDFWRLSQIGGMGGSFIIKVAWVWSSLWKDCFTDSAAVDTCKDYAYVWPVIYYVQAARGLLLFACSFGFVGSVFCFIGMECTYIGGNEKKKDRLLFAGAVFHFVGGMADMTAYCLYTNWVAKTAFAPNLPQGALRYDIGPPIFLGLIGAFFVLLGAILYAVTVYKSVLPESKLLSANGQGTYMEPRSGGMTYTGYYRPSRQYGYYMGSGQSNSSRVSKLSQTTPERMSERDAFV